MLLFPLATYCRPYKSTYSYKKGEDRKIIKLLHGIDYVLTNFTVDSHHRSFR